ncbi:hypothetical protein HDK77DRAFT_445889 [Phyllosticta capitalensis]|uniref:Uncharacterized protein n=1 Tax=Phyllosticta capitalensis TaxID=121624 RepID=A0ABR1YKX8_9PEZI
MPSQSASIQSYFSPHPSSSPSKPLASSSPPAHLDPTSAAMASTDFVTGDGFSSSERSIISPKTTTATDYTQPFVAPSTRPYQSVAISSLAPSSATITFVGRVVNIFHFANNNQKPRAATGCLRFILRGLDGTGLVTVRLWYADTRYPIRLGAKVAVWTTHLGLSEDGKLAPAVARLCASVFPERDRGCHVQVKNEEECEDRGVEKWSRQATKAELMTLEGFARGGVDVPDARVMACVKSVGARKKVTRKDNTVTENVTVHLFDNTWTEATLTLWDHSTYSASTWKPSQTVLLLTNPGYRTNPTSSKTWLALTSATTVDVDPPVRDALWLRAFAARQRRRQDVNPPFPYKTFKAQFTTLTESGDSDNEDESAESTTKKIVLTPVNRVLYTLASLDAIARSRPSHPMTGYLSVLLMPLNLVSMHQRHHLFSGHCSGCNFALHANTATTTCPSCSPPSSNRTDKSQSLPSSWSSWEGRDSGTAGPAEAATTTARLVTLRLNPRILGHIIDETGSVASGKLVWREEAWEELFGLPAAELAALDRETLRRLEVRCAWVRISLFVGLWSEDVSVGEEGQEGVESETVGKRGVAHESAEVVRMCVLGVKL